MVRFSNKGNAKRVSDFIYFLFHIQEFFTHIVEVNRPDIPTSLFAFWHCHQTGVYGIEHKKENLHVLVSRSRDGEIIANVIEKMGFKTIRGSKGKKGAIEASMQMISTLKSGENCAMMVDGPKGPPRVVKDGVVKISKLSGIPIVPVYMYSTNPSFVTFPSWDKMRLPVLDTNIINLYGEPVYVTEDSDEKEICKILQDSFENLEKNAPEAYKEVFWFGLLKKKRSSSSQFKWNP